jgi:hypothetical protein
MKKLSRKQLAYIILIVGLGVGYAMSLGGGRDRSGGGGFTFPTAAKIEHELTQIATLNNNRAKAQIAIAEQIAIKAQLKARTAGFWIEGTKVPTNEIQKAVDRLGRRAGIQLARVGAPREVDLSDHVKAVDISVNSTTDIQAFAAFIQEIDNSEPALFFENCSIRPDNVKNPKKVMVKGKIRALVLTKETDDFLISTGPAAPAAAESDQAPTNSRLRNTRGSSR